MKPLNLAAMAAHMTRNGTLDKTKALDLAQAWETEASRTTHPATMKAAYRRATAQARAEGRSERRARAKARRELFASARQCLAASHTMRTYALTAA